MGEIRDLKQKKLNGRKYRSYLVVTFLVMFMRRFLVMAD